MNLFHKQYVNIVFASMLSVSLPVAASEIQLPTQDSFLLAQSYSTTESAPEPVQPKAPKKRLFRYSYDVSLVNDDNIRRAQYKRDIREDGILNVVINAKAGKSLDSFTLLSYGGSIGYEAFETFDQLDNLNFNANIKYRFATSARFAAPIYTFSAKLGGIESESDMRDSTTLSIGFDTNRWLTTKINMTAGIDFKAREARTEVFDTSEGRIFVNFDLELSKSALLYGTYNFISGDIVSSATPSLEIINAAEVIESDDAFGGMTTNQFAYRLDADTQVLTLGYNHILTRSMSMDFSYRYVDSEATDNIYYERTILRASLLGRF